LMIALVDDEIAGFVIFHVDLQARLGRKWLLRNMVPILKFTVLNPLFTFRIAGNLLIALYNSRKARMNAPVDQNLVRTRNSRAYIETLAVKKSYRGLGVGKRLIEECIRVGRDNNKKRLGITVDTDNYTALGLYQAMGFKPQKDPFGGRLDLVYDIKM
ncbi:MAG: GCN5-related N-acetyltransferase, partial [Deltaproteobacteria bacterium]|nr:GCN5-related N-acetyltransferase [Deltaproteobacteria bacterium]